VASGGQAPTASNVENLLDIDFDGAAPAAVQKDTLAGLSVLEAAAAASGGGTSPARVASPGASSSSAPGTNAGGAAGGAPRSGLEDLMGVFGNGNVAATTAASNGTSDLLQGFAALQMGAGDQPPPPGEQLGGAKAGAAKKNEDIMSLF
jgi:hypothetical protein